MRIALFLPHLGVTGGLGVHCRSLITALLRVADSEDSFTVLAPADPRLMFPNTGLDDGWRSGVSDPRVRLVPLDWPAGFSLARPLDPVIGASIEAARPEVVYCSYYTGLEQPPCPQAIAFHDAGFLEFPQVFGDVARVRRETFERIRPAVEILQCVSADARDRVCRLLPFDLARSEVVWHCLPDSQAEFDRANDGERLDDWGEYLFLPVGAATGFNRTRKNVPTAVAAFRRLPPGSARLIVAGTGVLHEAMLAELLPAKELASGGIVAGVWRSADGAVRVLPSLDRAPFLAAMAHAAAVVYPSRYEGFGLPAIEAMALGVPLIVGRATSLPEVVGDAGLLIDPDDVAGFADAMRTVLSSPATVAGLVERGRERARLFTVERMGDAMLGIFRRLASR